MVKNGNMVDLCASLESLLEKENVIVSKTHMAVCDIYSNKVFKIFDPNEILSSIRDRDDIYM